VYDQIRKLHECVFWVEISHSWFSWPGKPTRLPLLSVFWGIFSSNRRKFNSEIQDPKFGHDVAMTLRRREQWCDYVAMTLHRQAWWRHLGPSLGAQAIRITSLRFHDVNLNTPVWYNRVIRKSTARLDCTLDNGKNFWIKFAESEIGFNDVQWVLVWFCATPLSQMWFWDLFFTKPRLILACDNRFYHMHGEILGHKNIVLYNHYTIWWTALVGIDDPCQNASCIIRSSFGAIMH
jgi:hypothetical protein